MKMKSEVNRLREENLKKNSERVKKLEKIRKNEIINRLVEKEYQLSMIKFSKSNRSIFS